MSGIGRSEVGHLQQARVDLGEDAHGIGFGDDAKVPGLGLALDMVAEVGDDLVGLGPIGGEPCAMSIEAAFQGRPGGRSPLRHDTPPT
jgi:hypothetical protein